MSKAGVNLIDWEFKRLICTTEEQSRDLIVTEEFLVLPIVGGKVLKFLTKKNTFSFYVFFFNVITVSITCTTAAEAGNGSTDSVPKDPQTETPQTFYCISFF